MAMRGWPLIKLLPQKTNFRFVKYAPAAGVISLILCVAAIVGCFYPGLNLGIDFRGGASMEVSKPAGQVLELDQVRGAVSDLGLGDVQVQGIDSASSAIVRFQIPEGEGQSVVVARVEKAIDDAVGEVKYSGVSVVGSKVSGELFTSGLLALGAAIVLMFIYIWFRFEPQFGFGALAGLVHDMVLTFGLIVLFRFEFSLNTVAAVLTVIGYSMNDTVVVFDRLRENLRKYKTMPLREVIDLSLNETLSRTIITGVTAVGVLAVLALFGGEALFGFSIVLMVGIIIGTYSSIYVGAPIILMWGVKRGGSADEDAKPIKFGMASRP
ncbi:protein translocase subunit SecF [Brevundimonas sp. 3P9-tot-E]|jgi:preprotein translocase subunit SecF|uniref:protein translocase subunit SecF n=1 Tax=Brevundimonas TaxID=41275 RepID=UPI000F7ABDFD|nr:MULTISPECIES: protein translocase subunit SecF [Brevundimonas]MDA0742248.1 protein translocase subunit SecF [Pseudomonadota bacterium]MBK1967987.1 protein translocase subunit SecF [Brevundimonas diminuta]MBK1974637.1 protein translocase subunit SecF [Brevundimonas diminuta]MDM8351407.1 protein translocase subunit SecF [Brevundimonas diminuta]RSB46873.1 protein translocase subunit SecF [Brevundimonas sp. 357]